MAWFSFGSEDIGAEVRAVKTLLTELKGAVVSANEELATIKSSLTEATTEIVAKIDELLGQVGDTADPALVAEVKLLAQGLADIVPNPEPEPEPETPVDGEPPVE